MLRVNSSAQHLAELTLVSGLKGRPKARSRSVSSVVGVTGGRGSRSADRPDVGFRREIDGRFP